MTLATEVLSDDARLDALSAGWDRLAVERGRPFSSPAWVRSWGRHLAPRDVTLRVVVVTDGDRLVAVAPFAVSGRDWLAPGGTLAPVEPLATAGQEEAAAAAIARALAAAEPRPRQIWVERQEGSPDWAALLGAGWDGARPWAWTANTAPIPMIEFTDGLDAWMAEKSGSFRRDLRRGEKRLRGDGGEFRIADADTLRADIGTFIALHRGRLASKGGSSLVDDRIEAMLAEVGEELLAEGRFRLISLAMDGATIAAQLLVCAGPEASAWNSGFDESFGRYSPVMQCIVHGLREVAAGGARSMSLGPGDQPYKHRLATRQDALQAVVLVPRGSGHLAARARLLPRQTRSAAADWLSDERKEKARAVTAPLRRRARARSG
jgi:CelD/BcsL family acetyltransferase involved in cellulose biosynthesis